MGYSDHFSNNFLSGPILKVNDVLSTKFTTILVEMIMVGIIARKLKLKYHVHQEAFTQRINAHPPLSVVDIPKHISSGSGKFCEI